MTIRQWLLRSVEAIQQFIPIDELALERLQTHYRIAIAIVGAVNTLLPVMSPVANRKTTASLKAVK